MSRPRTRIDGRKKCYWFPTTTLEKIDRIAAKLNVPRGAAIIAAIDAFDDNDAKNAAENVDQQKRLKKLEKIRKLLD